MWIKCQNYVYQPYALSGYISAKLALLMFRTFRTQFRTCNCEVDGCDGQLVSMSFGLLGASLVFELPMVAEYFNYDLCMVCIWSIN